jgi:hypothetical protein
MQKAVKPKEPKPVRKLTKERNRVSSHVLYLDELDIVDKVSGLLEVLLRIYSFMELFTRCCGAHL